MMDIRPSATLLVVAAIAMLAPAGGAVAAEPVRPCSNGSVVQAPEGGSRAGPFAVFDADGVTRSRLRGRYLWKTPVWVAAGRRIRVSIAPRDRSRARLVFDSPADVFPRGDLATRFRACPEMPGTGFAGSITTAPGVRALCLRLIVADEATRRRWVMRLPLMGERARRRCIHSRR